MSSLSSFISPGRYVQGPGALQELGTQLGRLGSSPLLISDDTVWSIVQDQITEGFEAAGLPVVRVPFGVFATPEAVDELVATIKGGGHDIAVGLGGGSTIDAAKAAGHLAGIRWASVPTTASSDAPCSALSVIYDDDGGFLEYRFFPSNPALVLVDTATVANAPVRLLIGGIGDALATWVEARATRRGRADAMSGGRPTHTGTALAKLSWELLHEHSLAAIDSVRAKVVTPALEAVVEANTLLSGLGFESGGLAAAHAIHDGLTALPQTHGLTHGQKVNIGSLTQLVMEGADAAEVEDFIVFTTKVGLPNTLTEVGLTVEDTEELRIVAETACSPEETMGRCPSRSPPRWSSRR